jgi:hypothetical protein
MDESAGAGVNANVLMCKYANVKNGKTANVPIQTANIPPTPTGLNMNNPDKHRE